MSKQIKSILVLAAALTVGLGSADAHAASCSNTVPSTNSEIDQYVETIPGDCGNTQVGGGGGSGGGSGSNGSAQAAVPASTQQALDALGADGAAAAQLANQTAPSDEDGSGGGGGSGSGGSGGGSGSGSGSGEPTADAVPDSSAGFSLGSVVAGLLSSFGGGSESGLGAGTPILLGSIALAGLAFLLLRRRSLG